MRRARYRLCARGLFWFCTHDGFILHPSSIGKAASFPATDVKSAGGLVQPFPGTARAFVSAPASTALVIAGNALLVTTNIPMDVA